MTTIDKYPLNITAERAVQAVPKRHQDFVRYILRIRDTVGGILVPLRTALDCWIDHAHPTINKSDRSRKRKALWEVLDVNKIMVDELTMRKRVMIWRNSTTPSQICKFQDKFWKMLPDIAPSNVIQQDAAA
jgi:hypothetical protein